MHHVPFQKATGPPVEVCKGTIPPTRRIIAHTDASIRPVGCGIGVVTRTSDDHFTSKTVLAAKTSREHDINELELSAVFLALETTDPSADIIVYTDSQTAIDNVIKKRTKKYDKLAGLVRESAGSRTGATYVCKVKAHANNDGNELAHDLAAEGTVRDYIFELPGARDLESWRAMHIGVEHSFCVFHRSVDLE